MPTLHGSTPTLPITEPVRHDIMCKNGSMHGSWGKKQLQLFYCLLLSNETETPAALGGYCWEAACTLHEAD